MIVIPSNAVPGLEDWADINSECPLYIPQLMAGPEVSVYPLHERAIENTSQLKTDSEARGDEVPELSVVIPVHNEAANIRSLLDEVCAALRGRMVFEIVVVDDVSTDETPVILRAAGHDMQELRPLRHRQNAGQSMSVLSGVLSSRAPVIVTLDGDGQNDPADIPVLWQTLKSAPDGGRGLLLAGHRVHRRDSAIKRLSSKIANAVRSSLLGDATPDTGCGVKMMHRDLFLRLPAFDHMHRFLPALVLRMGGQVRSVPVNHRPRGGGASHYGTWGG